MERPSDVMQPGLFTANPYLADEVNDAIIRSEIEGGVLLDSLPVGAGLEVETQNHLYRLVNLGRGRALLSGHPKFCPKPVRVFIHGSTWGGSMLKLGYVGRGMCLEFRRRPHGVITTSRIQEIRQV